MNYLNYIPGAVCLLVALLVMFRLMRYAPFYAPSYFFWIGVILVLAGSISLVTPPGFLFVFNRSIATAVVCAGVLASILSLYWPVGEYHSRTNLKIDALLPDYSFSEYHEVRVQASPEEIKHALQTIGVASIPVVHLLMKIRGIAGEKDMSDTVTNIQPGQETVSTPDFNFFVADQTEYITVMILKASAKNPPPGIKTMEQFKAFNAPGYVKVAINFRFVRQENGQILLSTETRNRVMTGKDRRVFGRYWRVIYPGSAIIRRLWLDALAREAGKSIINCHYYPKL